MCKSPTAWRTRWQQLEKGASGIPRELSKFLDGLVSHYVFDDGKLVVAHAGMKESMQGRGSGEGPRFRALRRDYRRDRRVGLPIRYNWAADYRGKALVVYGHTPVAEPLVAEQYRQYRYRLCLWRQAYGAPVPRESEIVSVPAGVTYYESAQAVS